MKINCYSDNVSLNIDFQNIIDDIEEIFTKKFLNNDETSLILVDINQIQEINKQYRSIDKPTDVISFEDDEEGYLGDIFICVDKVIEQAQLYSHTMEREFAFLLCHGLLHLLGYDHITTEDEKTMFALQDELLNNTLYTREK